MLGFIFETTIRLTLARKRQDWIYCCAQNVTVLTVKVNKSMLIREQQSRQIRWIGRPRRGGWGNINGAAALATRPI